MHVDSPWRSARKFAVFRRGAACSVYVVGKLLLSLSANRQDRIPEEGRERAIDMNMYGFKNSCYRVGPEKNSTSN